MSTAPDPTWRREAVSTIRRRTLGARPAYVLFFLFCALYIAGYTWMSWHLHDTFVTSADDLSNVDQVVWNSQHGRLLERTTGTRSVPRYGEHVEPIWIAFGLIYFVWDDVRALLLAQTVALAAGAIPVFWLARDAWGRECRDYLAGLTFAAIYLLNPFVSRANIAEVHATPFAVAPMLLALYWGWRGKWARVAPLVLLVLLVREDTGLLVAAFGLWILLRRLARWPAGEPASGGTSTRAALGLIAAGIAGVTVMLFGIIRSFADERFSGQTDSVFFGRYAAFGEGPLGILWGMVTRWGVWAELLSDPYRLTFLRDFALATGGLGLFAPLTWLLFAPHLLLNLLSDYFGQYGSLQHYGAPLVPGMMVAPILGGARLVRWGGHRPAWRLLVLGVALAGALITARNATGQPFAVDWITPAKTEHHRLLDEIIALIPPHAPLSADPQLHPHVAHRHDAYRFPVVGDNAEWILVDVTTNSTRHPVQLKQDVEALLAADWGVAHAEDGYLLLQRGNANKAIPPDFYRFTVAQEPPEIPVGAVIGSALEIAGYSLYQDFWGRVGVEWQVRRFPDVAADSGQADYPLDAALLDSEQRFVPETESQPIPALVWRPFTTWQPDVYYVVRTLPRHTTSPFFPAIGADTDIFGYVFTPCRGQCALRATPVVIPEHGPPSWIAAGEWRLENNHARRGNAGWRQFDSPSELAPRGGVWEIAELRSWQVEESEEELRVSLTWHALRAPATPIHRFVHLVPGEGAAVPIAQADDVLGSQHPVTWWVEGEWVQETFSLGLPSEGTDWRLLVGLYDPATGIRLEVMPDAGDRAFQFYP